MFDRLAVLTLNPSSLFERADTCSPDWISLIQGVLILFHLSDPSALLRSLIPCWHVALPRWGLGPPALVNASGTSVAQGAQEEAVVTHFIYVGLGRATAVLQLG